MKTLTKTFARRVISALLVTIMVFSLGITSIVSTSAANVDLAPTSWTHTGGYLYFVKPDGWKNVSILIGHNGDQKHSKMFTLSPLSGSLYYTNSVSYENWGEWIIVDATGWEESWSESPSQRTSTMTNKSDTALQYEFNSGTTYLLNTTTGSTSYHGSYTALNYLQTAVAQVSTDGGSTYTNSTDGGTVSVKTYKLTGNGTGSTASATGSRRSAIGTSVTMTATENAGYDFMGWYSGSTKVGSDLTYTYTNSGSAKTVYAKFKSLLEVSLAEGQDTELSATVGETVTIKATATGSTSYTYTLVNGVTEEAVEGISTNSTGSFTVPCNAPGTYTYKVQASSGTASKVTDGTVTVTVTDYDFQVDAESPGSVMTYQNILIKPSSNAPENAKVEYTLKDGDTEITPETSGNFLYTTVAGDSGKTKTFTLTATTTIGTTNYTKSKEISVEITPFDLSVTLTAPETIECGLKLDLMTTAFVPQGTIVDYHFTNETTGEVLNNNRVGTHSFYTLASDAGKTFIYKVTATATVGETTYTASDQVQVEITGVTEFYNITVFFKGSGTLGYRPMISTTGAVSELKDADMNREIFITTNESQTAHYYWFSADIQVSKAKPTVTVKVLSERYDFEGKLTLEVTKENQEYFLAVDDLHSGTEMVDLSELPLAEQVWCRNALHMVYDSTKDDVSVLEEVKNYPLAAIADANLDGVINIKDATYIQKALVNMVALDDVSTVVSDVNDDGTINVKDATALQKQLAGL